MNSARSCSALESNRRAWISRANEIAPKKKKARGWITAPVAISTDPDAVRRGSPHFSSLIPAGIRYIEKFEREKSTSSASVRGSAWIGRGEILYIEYRSTTTTRSLNPRSRYSRCHLESLELRGLPLRRTERPNRGDAGRGCTLQIAIASDTLINLILQTSVSVVTFLRTGETFETATWLQSPDRTGLH